jgi:thioredoxin reductase (NADPH)
MNTNSLQAIAFPKLDEAQLAGLESCPLTTQKRFREGEKLFEVGQSDFKFFVVKSGRVEIVDESSEPPRTVRMHGPGEFTGEVAQLTGNPALVSAIARGDCEVFQISRASLREILNHHPDLGDIILQAFIARRQLLRESKDFTGVLVIGSRYSQQTFRIRDFLTKNGAPFTWVDLDDDLQVKQLLPSFTVTEAETPMVVLGNKVRMRNPTIRQLAEALGLCRPLQQTEYDLVVVGAGPSGLAAAVYGASEGLSTLVLERVAPGGQAGRSMRIENYLGFPAGITGAELAERAMLQANKFGAALPVACGVAALKLSDAHPVLQLESGETVTAKCVLIATGADYRLLSAEGCELYEGRGIYYAATPLEAQMCRGSDVIVVGGGNSAGQAAVFLAGQVRKVHIVIRGDDLKKDMSTYLIRRIEETPNIEVLRNMEVRRMTGDGHLGEVELVNNKTGEVRKLNTPAVFSFIGAVPRTEWLPPEIERDAKGFVRTGPSVAASTHWSARRQPFLLETSRPGVFAAGDVRSGSVKRVASAVGEGSMAVQFVHEYFKEIQNGNGRG